MSTRLAEALKKAREANAALTSEIGASRSSGTGWVRRLERARLALAATILDLEDLKEESDE